ncbi:type II secretion system F family protein [Enterobacter kobei]|uniref:type II secretion system F family protein n=1 Tax=Enterobacterales TaxID=91347 RepID=UPI000DA0FF20|nr:MULTISPECIES: type II secretion system F family protein [Enterobacterales]EKY1504585.1 type II secretion system F family protein [Enterobacter cloacae]MBH0128453.1 type II secretion system F family protein [Enterobacter sp. SECR18-0236]MDX7542850.1 type II secretion system F family protein [Serratia marcescens]PYZ20453.1 pilus assembly protein PilR [Enterobacter cloacae complex sp.]RAY67527.1 pilus assembly protein PilR [Enterobacter kobei]
MREMNLFRRIRHFIVRKTFAGPYRVQFYEALGFLIENRQQLKAALQQMRDAWTDFGQRWHPFAELTDDCIEALRENAGEKTLEKTLARWLPETEAAVIIAGIHSDKLPQALKYATTLTDAGKRIMESVWQMSIYPLALVVMLAGTVWVLNEELVPSLSEIIPPEQWTGALGFLYNFSVAVNEYGLIGGIVLAIAGCWVVWSLAHWHRPDALRRVMDGFMPWSVYQDIQGAAFLLNIAALIRAGVQTKSALQMLRNQASPWLAVRIDAIIASVREGENLGHALRECGYNFPSREAANFLSVLQGDGADELISNYGLRWLEQTLVRIRRRAVVVRLIMLTVLVMTLMLLVFAAMDIISVSDPGMGTF